MVNGTLGKTSCGTTHGASFSTKDLSRGKRKLVASGPRSQQLFLPGKRHKSALENPTKASPKVLMARLSEQVVPCRVMRGRPGGVRGPTLPALLQ